MLYASTFTPMQIQALFNWKSIRSYILGLLLVIVLIIVTVYLSKRRLAELDKEKPRLGMRMHSVPDPSCYYLTNPFNS